MRSLRKEESVAALLQECSGQKGAGAHLFRPSPSLWFCLWKKEHLYRKHHSWLHIALHHLTGSSVPVHRVPSNSAAHTWLLCMERAGCRQRRGYVHQHSPTCHQMASAWKPAVSLGFVGPLGNAGQGWDYFQLWGAKCELTLGRMPSSAVCSCQKSSPSGQQHQTKFLPALSQRSQQEGGGGDQAIGRRVLGRHSG